MILASHWSIFFIIILAILNDIEGGQLRDELCAVKVHESLTIKNMWMSEFTRQDSFYYNQSSVLVSDCQYLSSSCETKQGICT